VTRAVREPCYRRRVTAGRARFDRLLQLRDGPESACVIRLSLSIFRPHSSPILESAAHRDPVPRSGGAMSDLRVSFNPMRCSRVGEWVGTARQKTVLIGVPLRVRLEDESE